MNLDPLFTNRLRYYLSEASVASLYIFMIAKTFLWGFAVGVLRQRFHLSFPYLAFVNSEMFGLVMMGMAALAGYNLLWPVRYKHLYSYIISIFLSFCLFHMSFVTLEYLVNRPIDGAWARNFVEVIAILWMMFVIKNKNSSIDNRLSR
jgi:hypothetical protein